MKLWCIHYPPYTPGAAEKADQLSRRMFWLSEIPADVKREIDCLQKTDKKWGIRRLLGVY